MFLLLGISPLQYEMELTHWECSSFGFHLPFMVCGLSILPHRQSLQGQTPTTPSADLNLLTQCLAHCVIDLLLPSLDFPWWDGAPLNASKCLINSSISRKLKINHIFRFLNMGLHIADEPSWQSLCCVKQQLDGWMFETWVSSSVKTKLALGNLWGVYCF